MLSFGPNVRGSSSLPTLSAALSNWPGIPAEHAMPFRNVSYVDDLFSWGEAEVPGMGEEEADDEWEDEEDDSVG